MTQEQQIRQQLAKALDWGEAHADFRTVIDDFPFDLRGEVPPGFTHSAWELLEHLRIALWDVVEFTKDARHKSPPWPQGYWPPSPVPPRVARTPPQPPGRRSSHSPRTFVPGSSAPTSTPSRGCESVQLARR